MILLKIPYGYKCHLCFDDYIIKPIKCTKKENGNIDLNKTNIIFVHTSNDTCINKDLIIDTKLEDFLVSEFI